MTETVVDPNELIAGVIPYHPSWEICDSSKLVEEYLTCERKDFFRNVLGWKKEGPNIHLVFGESWHRMQEVVLLADYHPDCIIHAHDIFEEYYRQFYTPMTDDINYPKTPGRALDAIAQYIRQYGASDSVKYECLHTEVAGSAPLIGGGVIYFRIDSILRNRETNQKSSREHKTGSRLDYKWRDKWDIAIQMGTYTHVLYCLYPPEEVYGLTINGAIFRKNDTEFLRVPVRKPPAMMEAWLVEVSRFAKARREEMQLLSACSPDDVVMNAFPRRTVNCMQYYGCPYHPFCTSWANPLAHCEAPPMGFEIEFWNPMDKKHSATVDLGGDKEVRRVG